jgi:hypothetical protein
LGDIHIGATAACRTTASTARSTTGTTGTVNRCAVNHRNLRGTDCFDIRGRCIGCGNGNAYCNTGENQQTDHPSDNAFFHDNSPLIIMASKSHLQVCLEHLT